MNLGPGATPFLVRVVIAQTEILDILETFIRHFPRKKGYTISLKAWKCEEINISEELAEKLENYV